VRSAFLLVLLSVLATLMALTPVGYVAWRNLPPRVATVDLQKLVEEAQKPVIDVLGKGDSVSGAQRKAVEKLTVEFAGKLSGAIDTLGTECHCVLINKAALLGGTHIDYTDLVRERLKKPT
jgi:hypothetical protein